MGNGPGWLICLGGFCVSMCGCGILGMPLNAKASKVVVLKCGWEVLAESYHEEGKSCGTKRGVRLR